MASDRSRLRVDSIDVVRGLVMVLMAIDHVRVYAGVPPGGPDPGVFFTRWVTHIVAPAFVFLAGTSAWLYGRAHGGTRALSRYLFTRGLWLVLLELTVLRLAWTFNLDYGSYLLAGVIWMLGWCMVLMAGLVFLPVRAIGAAGVAIVALHNLADPYVAGNWAAFGEAGPPPVLALVYAGGVVSLGSGGPPLFVLFVIVPWIGVMMAGYAFGTVVARDAAARRRLCLVCGLALVAAFAIVRGVDVYGDPRPWRESRLPAALAFLATTKYPASLSFLLMTIGPMLVLLGLVEGWRGRAAGVLRTFGRVPFFYYVLHIPVIHAAAVLVSLAREGRVHPWLLGNHPVAPPPVPDGYMWSLPLLYLVFGGCVAVLYVPCRWYARRRATHPAWWHGYV